MVCNKLGSLAHFHFDNVSVFAVFVEWKPTQHFTFFTNWIFRVKRLKLWYYEIQADDGWNGFIRAKILSEIVLRNAFFLSRLVLTLPYAKRVHRTLMDCVTLCFQRSNYTLSHNVARNLYALSDVWLWSKISKSEQYILIYLYYIFSTLISVFILKVIIFFNNKKRLFNILNIINKTNFPTVIAI